MGKETSLDSSPRFKVFSYVRKIGYQGIPLCPEGQRTAAAEAYDLFNAGGEKGKQRMLNRAILTEEQLKKGIAVIPSQYISWFVIELFCAGILKEYADKHGAYTLQDRDKSIKDANVFEDIRIGKTFYPITK